MKTVFVAQQFTHTQWDTREDKAKFANHFVRFVESGYKETLFHDWFYKRLSNTFGHIAHYDREGFYATMFTSPQSRLRFAHITSEQGGYGDPKFTYSDVESALKRWACAYGLVEKAVAELSDSTERAERAELARLQAKYGGDP